MGNANKWTGVPGLWLALDTSTSAMTAALLSDGEVIASSLSRSERNHSIRLLPAVQELFAESGVDAAALGGVAVGRGPGSYTGIRIGVTVAKTLAWTLDVPLIGISSLEALAHGAARRAGLTATVNQDEAAMAGDGAAWVIPFVDARRGKAYTGLYAVQDGAWRSVEPDGIRPMEGWLNELIDRLQAANAPEQSDAAGRVRRVVLCGEGFEDLLAGLAERWPADAVLDSEPLLAEDVGRLAAMYGKERTVHDVHAFEPNYTQLSEPEKKLGMQG